MLQTGCDRLLASPHLLAGRRYGLLGHGASVSAGLVPLHLALAASAAGAPRALYGPEHGYYGIEQDMVASADERDPWTGAPVRSLYGDHARSLVPAADAFDGLDLLLIDLQDVGCRYYTYAATAVWAAEAALAQGVEVWLLDRPNPLGGTVIEGSLRDDAFVSFIGAFRLPVRHGLTLGELFGLEAERRGWDTAGLRVWPLAGWPRDATWDQLGRPWIAPSPNMPTPLSAALFPGICLVEATTLSEGRGTTRPFQLVGAPGIDPLPLAEVLTARALPGVRFVPTYFRPQFQKHAGARCAGVELVVTDRAAFPAYRCGIELLAAVHTLFPEVFAWRAEPYEFVAEVPAIDLLTGDATFRRLLEAGAPLADWIAGWSEDEAAFRAARAPFLLDTAAAP